MNGGTALLVVIGLAGFLLRAAFAPGDQWTVVEVPTGSTFVAEQGDDRRTFRLGEVAVPDPAAGTEEAKCLAKEARVHLGQVLPVGSKVTIHTTDDPPEGMDVVGIEVNEKSVVEGIVTQGLGMAFVEPDAPVHGPSVDWNHMEDIEDQAVKKNRGLFDPDHGCTFAASVVKAQKGIDRALRDAVDESSGSAAAIRKSIGALEKAYNRAMKLHDRLEKLDRDEGPAMHRLYARFSPYFTMPLEDSAGDASTRISELESRLNELEAPAIVPAPSSPYSGTESSPGSGYDGYTGPRCYAPGGKTYVPCG